MPCTILSSVESQKLMLKTVSSGDRRWDSLEYSTSRSSVTDLADVVAATNEIASG